MTTHHDIFGLIVGEIDNAEREDVLRPLCAAFVEAYDNEVDEDAHERDHDMLPHDSAHLYYVDCYYKARMPELRAKPRTTVDPKAKYLEVNPREVSVPEWARNHRRLLRALAQAERKRDEAALSYLREAC